MSRDPTSSKLWDGLATRYDGLRPDQGLTDPLVRAAWAALLADELPAKPCRVLDAGCGTGSLSLLLAEMGHTVTGIDFAPEMIAEAQRKAATTTHQVTFEVQDASAPTFPPNSFDAIICRQALWALPDKNSALTNWSKLLTETGTLVLIEGKFASGNGLSEGEILSVLPATFARPKTVDISQSHPLWGGPIPDQRLLITTHAIPLRKR